jgi:predicted MFS family arabinose efflux permease
MFVLLPKPILPVEEVDLNKRISNDDDEEKLEIWPTIMMMKEKRIALMYPVICAAGVGTAVFTLMASFITDTMYGMSINEQLSLSAECFVVYGVGRIIGNFVMGQINDKLGGGKSVAKSMLIINLISYSLLVVFNEIHLFSPFIYPIMFFFGVQESSFEV